MSAQEDTYLRVLGSRAAERPAAEPPLLLAEQSVCSSVCLEVLALRFLCEGSSDRDRDRDTETPSGTLNFPKCSSKEAFDFPHCSHVFLLLLAVSSTFSDFKSYLICKRGVA